MTRPSIVATILVTATILAEASDTSSAQAETLRAGTFVERVACEKDPTQTYTLYLPKAYTPHRPWPLLFVFDPRGRGMMAAEIFKDAAERFGWIIASSDNTRSDGPWEPNRRAILAMWPDALTRYAVDEKRIYAAGFSGGAGVATVVAATTGHIAGIIAAGAPDPGESEKTPPVAWFGAAGRVDFNFLDAKSTDERMRRAGNRRRLEYFEGGHQWLPRAMAMRAAGWLEALAMKDGRRARDPQLAGELRDADVAAGLALEEAGRLTDAYRVYSSVTETLGELTDVSRARARVAALDADPRMAQARKEEQRVDREERDRSRQLSRALGELRADELPMLPMMLSSLRVDTLKRDAKTPGYKAESAQRTLEQIFVQTSFYVWREFEEKKDYARAALCLEIATAIHPDRPRVWYDLAGDRAALRDQRSALSALERAIETGFTDRARLEGDERFASIRQTDEFSRLVARLSFRPLHHSTTRSFAIEQISMKRLNITSPSSD
jgi:dienelactone hydrolase